MNPMKKSPRGLLANPFGSKNPKPSSAIPHNDYSREAETNQNSEAYQPVSFTSNNPSSIIIPPQIRLRNHSFTSSQQDPSKMHVRNPLRRNINKSTDIRRPIEQVRNQSIDEVGMQRVPIKNLIFNSNNPFEQFRQIIQEIERRDAKIKTLESSIRLNKQPADSQELAKAQNALNDAINKFHDYEHQYNDMQYKNNSTKKQIEDVIAKVNTLKPQVDRQKNFFKTVPQLQTELNNQQYQLGMLRGEYGKKAMTDKIKIEQEFKNKIEMQLFDVALEVAKDSKNPEIIKIYNKIKSCKLQTAISG